MSRYKFLSFLLFNLNFQNSKWVERTKVQRINTTFFFLSCHIYVTTILCSRGSQGKNTEVVCRSLLQWTTVCQTSPPWPVRLGWPYMACLSFVDLDKAVVLWPDRLASFLWLWFQYVCPLMPSRNIYCLTWVSLTLDVAYLCMPAPAKCSRCSLPWTRVSPPDLECGVAPLSPPAPMQQTLLGRGLAPLGRCPVYLTSMQSTSWETLGWKKHKLESRLPGEISITSDMQMTPPLWQKGKRN